MECGQDKPEDQADQVVEAVMVGMEEPVPLGKDMLVAEVLRDL
jgi:hypothetical protein